MAKRRMNGEGTVYQRKDGLWIGEVTIGYDKDKKRIKKTVSSMDLDKLQKKMNDLRHKHDNNMLLEPSKYTVSEWVSVWLETYKKESIKPSTYDMYRGSLDRYITPKLGHIKLDKLNPIMVQNFIKDVSKQGKNGKELSHSSVKKIYITLSQACKKAVDVGLLHKNPCDSAELPKKESRKALAFTPEEQEAFLLQCKQDSVYDHLFIFAFNTGMRLGEMQALMWEDVDLEKNIVAVNKTLSVINDYESEERKNRTIINSTKTESGIRIIPLTKKAAEIINIRKQHHNDSPFIFSSASGRPLVKRSIYRAFKTKMSQAKITSHLTMHSTRHSFATRLLEKGADVKSVSELLGHKNIQITLDLYAHVFDELKNNTIDLLN